MSATRRRRTQLAKRIGDGFVILTAAAAACRSRDTNYPYRPDSYFYYLTGFVEPQSALLLSVKAGRIAREILLCRGRDRRTEQWNGERLGPLRARRQLQIEETADIMYFDSLLSDVVSEHDHLYCLPGTDAALDAKLITIISNRRAHNRDSTTPIQALCDVSLHLDAMRLIKDTEEIELLRKAAQISSDGHRAAMRAVRYSKNEMQVEAALVAAFRSAGAHYAFEPIVASGKNACTLHYCANNAPVRQRHLVLVDAGAEYCGYAGDVTRTFPASGKFTEAQADVYDIVLAAQKKALTAIKPGNTWSAIENTATRTLAQGLIDLGLCKGTIKTVLKKSNYQRFYMHRIGHFLGLDVHDVGRHKNIAGKQEPLRAGMVVTVEPGLYIPDEPDIPAPLRGIGVRIEDDVLVTDNGKEVLSGAPKTRTDIEAWIHG